MPRSGNGLAARPGLLPDDHYLPPGDLRGLPDEQEVAGQFRRTVIHEVANHFGIDDDRLSEFGW